MTPKNALYQVIENAIKTVGNSSPLVGAVTLRSLKGSVDEASKVVRVQSLLSGQMSPVDEPQRQYNDADYIVQCFCKPDGDTLKEEDEALEKSLEMAYAIFRIINSNYSLDGAVCDAAEELGGFDCDYETLGGQRFASTYLYGKFNLNTG